MEADGYRSCCMRVKRSCSSSRSRSASLRAASISSSVKTFLTTKKPFKSNENNSSSFKVCPIARPRSVSWTYFLVKVFGENLCLLDANDEAEEDALKEARAPDDKDDDDEVALKP